MIEKLFADDPRVKVEDVYKRQVDIYACGHIHNFQHLRVPGSDIDYVVNSAGSLLSLIHI